MGKYSKKGLEKRKKEREGYAEFFKRHISIIKERSLLCYECGERLRGHVSEIAHILPKQTFKSIAIDDDNVVYLCGMYSKNNCHSKYDDSKLEIIKDMKIYPELKERFKALEEKITERIPYKTHEKFD